MGVDAGESNRVDLEGALPLSRLVIYAKNVEETARFYEKHFSFKAMRLPGDRILEMVSQDGGANIMLHSAAKGQRSGQTTVKLVFDVEDIEDRQAGLRCRGHRDILCAMRQGRSDVWSDPYGGRLSVR